MSTALVGYRQDAPEVRNRATVFFRYVLSFPHAIVSSIYGIAAGCAIVAAWFTILFTGRIPPGVYNLIAGVHMFNARFYAYFLCLTDEFPPFGLGQHPEYPVNISIPPQQPEYDRLKTLFRGILLIPVYVVAWFMAIWAMAMSIALWFSAVFTGRTSRSLTESVRQPMAYLLRTGVYGSLLTEDWPPFGPGPDQLGPGPGQHVPQVGGPPDAGGPTFVKR